MTKFKLVFGICMFVLILGVTCSFAQTPADAIKAKGKSLISTMDSNKDGLISKEEYVAKCKGANCGQRFDSLDANKDGFLNKEEAQQGVAKAKERIDAMDTNKDGKISKEEFLASCKGTDCSQRFDSLDANKDGFLDKAEAQEKAAAAKQKGAAFRDNFKNRVQSGQQPSN